MEVKASAKHLRVSPRKLRLIARGLRGLSPQKALDKLGFRPQKGQEYLKKVIKQGVANAKTNFKMDETSLVIRTIDIGEGPVYKRRDMSHGARFNSGLIKKRTAHLFLTLGEVKETKASEMKAVKNSDEVKDAAEKETTKEAKKVKTKAPVVKKPAAKAKPKPVKKENK
jgi:large subunit ribosomal protein L22